MELLNSQATKLTENTKVLKLINNQKQEASYDDLMIGMNNIYIRSKNNEIIEEILIDGEPIFSRIRVAIRNTITNISDINTLYHDNVTVLVNSDTTIDTYDGSQTFDVKANTTLTFTTNGKDVCFYKLQTAGKVGN